jgi:oligopeptide/dipeptide ABC transporter ATP-binding protein
LHERELVDKLISIQDLHVYLMSARGAIHAARGVSLGIERGEIHGIVGESGCGKSVTAKSIMRLNAENASLYEGQIFFGRRDILSVTEREMQELRGKEISMIFQDPMTALNPLYTIGHQMEETLLIRKFERRDARRRVLELMESVGVNPPEERCRQYPFEMSGGMLQRVMIAMSIACGPQLLIADEPTTALDVTVQAQILELLLRLKDERDMSIMIITHNFGVVAEICGRVSVMYAGRIVESGDVREIFRRPMHPYTRDLIESIPRSGTRGEKLSTIPGKPPDLLMEITGCPYAPRCSRADETCREIAPGEQSASESHSFACHRGI